MQQRPDHLCMQAPMRALHKLCKQTREYIGLMAQGKEVEVWGVYLVGKGHHDALLCEEGVESQNGSGCMEVAATQRFTLGRCAGV